MTGNVRAGKAYIELGVKDSVDKGLRSASKKLKKFGTQVAGVGAKLAAVSAGVLAGPLALASEYQETMGKFDVVFGDAAAAMKDWSDATAKAMGVGKTEMAGMLSGLQDLFVPMGMMPGAAADMSKELSKLAIDLGSFNNLATSSVMIDLMAAMTGSGETMKKYGVILSEASVKQELLNQGMDPKKATEAQKAQARLNIIMRSTTAAQGDAIRTAGSFANQTKRLWANIKNLGTAIGEPLLEPLSKVLKVINALSTKVGEWMAKNTQIVRMVTLGVAAVGALGAALVGLGLAISVAGVAVGGLAAAIGFLVSPVGAVIAAVGALGYVIATQTNFIGEALAWVQERFGDLFSVVRDTVDRVSQALAEGNMAEAWDAIVEAMEYAWLDLTQEIHDAWDGVMRWMVGFTGNIASGIGKMFQALGDGLKNMLDRYKSYYNSVYNWVTEKIGEAGGVRTIGGPVDAFGGAGDGMRGVAATISGIGAAMSDSADAWVAGNNKDREARKRSRQERLESLKNDIAVEAERARERRDAPKAPDAPGLPELQSRLGGMSAASKGTTAGAFSSAAAMLLGGGMGGSIQERQLRAMQRTADNTDEIKDESEKANVGVFA